MSAAEEAVGARMLDMAVATFDLLSVAIGDRLGYYACLAQHGAMTAGELAAATRTAPRYAREWLEQQAATGLLDHQPASADGSPSPRFALAEGVGTVLAAPEDVSHLAPLARQLAAAARQLPAIAEAVRGGGGVPWAAYGPDMRESEADLNRPAYQHLLAEQWLAALPDVRERLRSDPPARVADVGCGAGWSTIALAAAHPRVRVDGYELDEASAELARANVAGAGLDERVRIRQQDIGAAEGAGRYDLVTVFECLHDLAHPVAALRAMHRLLAGGGCVLVADMKVAETFTAPADPVERLMYGFSLMVCLPDSLSSTDSAATGTVMRRSTVFGYAREAGFPDVQVLPIEHDLWRFYRLDR